MLPLKELRKAVAPRQLLAVYLTGSRLNHLNLVDTDYDLYLVVTPTLRELTHGQNVGTEFELEKDGKLYQCKMMNIFQFLKVTEKSNPNMAEIFYQEPQYSTLTFQQFHDVVATQVVAMHEEYFVKSSLGQAKQTSKRFSEKTFDHLLELTGDEQKAYLTRLNKEVVNAVKFLRYIAQYYETGALRVDFSDDQELLALKKLLYVDEPVEQVYTTLDETMAKYEPVITEYGASHTVYGHQVHEVNEELEDRVNAAFVDYVLKPIVAEWK